MSETMQINTSLQAINSKSLNHNSKHGNTKLLHAASKMENQFLSYVSMSS